MSLIRRAMRGKRVPARSFAPVYPSYVGATTGSYADVLSEGPGASMQQIAVWSAIDLIASLGSELPFDVMRGKGPGAAVVATPSYLDDPAGDGYGYNDWAWQLLHSWLATGNNFGEVLERDPRGGFPIQVSHWPEGAVSATLVDGRPKWTVQGREVPDRGMWHTRAYPAAGAILGMSPIRHHMVTIGQGLAASRFGLQFYTDGAHPTAILQNEETEIDERQAKTVKERWMAVLAGSREPAVFGRGWKYTAAQVNPEESQFLETNRYTQAACARIYGPGVAELLGFADQDDSMTYANVVDRRADLLVFSGNKWLNRLERVLTAMLPRGQFVRLNRNALLQSTTLDRFRAYELALKNRWQTVNEVRELEDLPPVAWGDEPNSATPAAPAAPSGGDDRGAPIRAWVDRPAISN